jgi:hypothetical protein
MEYARARARMLRAAVSAEDMGQRALAAGLLLCLCVHYCYRSDFVFNKKKRMLRTAVSASSSSPQDYYCICVSSTAIEEVFFCIFFVKIIYLCAQLYYCCMCVSSCSYVLRAVVSGEVLCSRVFLRLCSGS